MKRFRYRALVEFDQGTSGRPGGQYPSSARALTVHARRIGEPSGHKYFPATIVWDDQQPPPGEHVVVTITVTDDAAPSYFAPGQPFTIWGESTGRGIISRRLPADPGPG